MTYYTGSSVYIFIYDYMYKDPKKRSSINLLHSHLEAAPITSFLTDPIYFRIPPLNDLRNFISATLKSPCPRDAPGQIKMHSCQWFMRRRFLSFLLHIIYKTMSHWGEVIYGTRNFMCANLNLLVQRLIHIPNTDDGRVVITIAQVS